MSKVSKALGNPATPYQAGNTGAAFVFDGSIARCQNWTLSANTTVTFINLDVSQIYTLICTQDATGSRTLTAGAGVTNPANLTLTPTITATTGVSTYLIQPLTPTTAQILTAGRQ